jgi:hypothetical protein
MLAAARSLLGVSGGFTSFLDSKHMLFSNYKSIGRFIQMVHRNVCCIVFIGGKSDEAQARRRGKPKAAADAKGKLASKRHNVSFLPYYFCTVSFFFCATAKLIVCYYLVFKA